LKLDYDDGIDSNIEDIVSINANGELIFTFTTPTP